MKKYKIKLTYRATDDISDIDYYLSVDLASPQTALEFIEKIRRAISSLNIMPERHSKIDHELLEVYNVRLYPIGGFLIIYSVDNENNIVEIMRVIHSRIDYKSEITEILSFL